MPVSRTLAQIETKARQLADQEQGGLGPELVDAEEMEDRANDSLTSFWEFLTRNGADELLAQRVELTGPSDTPEPTFPEDFYKLLKFQVQDGGWQPIHRLRDDDQDSWDAEETPSVGSPRYYQLRGVRTNPIRPRLYPSPGTATRTYRLEYVPDAPRFDSTADPAVTTLELPNSWWRWIEYDVAIGLLDKEESDSRALMQRREEMGATILSSMTDVDYSEPRRIRDRRGLLGSRSLPDYRRRERYPW